MRLLVNALGAWVAVRAAEGHYPRPVAIGLTMLVSRLGTGAAALAVAGYALKRLDEAGAFDEFKQRRPIADTRNRLGAGGRSTREEVDDEPPRDDQEQPARS